jgi:sugar phosphate isomerase/epimerase
MMKLAFSTLGCHEYSVDEIIACAVKYGFDGVELRHVEKNVRLWETPDLKPETIGTTKKKFNDAGIEVAVVGTSVSFAFPEENVRRRHLDDLKRWAEVAQSLSCPYVRVFAGPVPEGGVMEESLKNNIEGYSEAQPLIAPYGIQLLFETHDNFSTSNTILPLLDGLNKPKDSGGIFGVVWDVLHPLRCGENVEETWENLKPYVKHIHIKDSFVFSETEADFKLCGEGKVPIPKIIELLKKDNYSGYLSFEWERGWHPEIAHCDIAFPHYAEYMKKLLTNC